ncbi:hypothetical protein HJFPF1_10854 [Paramyrothecium foliicola]|nr:hypothetical protein HJFPF1_10854 [Paramyrothecium foliicola]
MYVLCGNEMVSLDASLGQGDDAICRHYCSRSYGSAVIGALVQTSPRNLNFLIDDLRSSTTAIMRSSSFHTLFLLSSLTSTCLADWQFRSRPEFAVPRLNITVPANSNRVDKGFIFVTPYTGFGETAAGPTQPGAYIYRDDGELVWSGQGYYAGWVANFVPDTWNGKPHLRAFQGRLDGLHGRMYGYHTLLGSNYEVAKVIGVGAHRLVSAHEFRLVDGKTALIETPIPRTVSLKPWGGEPDQNWVVSGGFQEIDIESGRVIFEWESLDHVDPKYCTDSAFPLDFGDGLPGSGRNETDAWNYFHINSVDKDDEGNYLISARNVAAVFKINGTSGEVIWQLGGLKGGSSFKLIPHDQFGFQHHARFHGRSSDGRYETISLFDNGAHSASIQTHPYSRARIYEIDHHVGAAEAIRTFDAPDKLSARTQGSVQLLPNGNAFVNWGQAGAVTEFSDGGEVLFHSYLDSAPHGVLVQSYRGFRANWTGTPSEEPAIVAFTGDEDELDIYVSWNGDTETKKWRFFAHQIGQEKGIFLGESRREGFETRATFQRHKHHEGNLIVAEAVDVDDRVLGRTRAVNVSRDPHLSLAGYGNAWYSAEEL